MTTFTYTEEEKRHLAKLVRMIRLDEADPITYGDIRSMREQAAEIRRNFDRPVRVAEMFEETVDYLESGAHYGEYLP